MKKLILILMLMIFASTASAQCFCTWSPVGRVLDDNGRSIRGAMVTLYGCPTIECDEWTSWVTYTNTFGYFRFDNIPMQTSVVEVLSRRPYGYRTALISPTETELPFTMILEKQ